MAYANSHDTHTTSTNIRQTLARPFVALGNLMVSITEALAMAQAASRVAGMSDERLASKGLTRSEAIELVFSGRAV